jgi:hypothetical protein
LGRGESTLAWLKRFYERDPRRFAISQLSFLLGVIVVYLWVIPIWYWAIYRGGLPVSQGVSGFLYWVWLNEQVFRGILIVLIILFLLMSYYVRRDPWRDLGVRVDNLWASARECLVVILVFTAVAVAVVLAFPDAFSFDDYLARGRAVIVRDIIESLLFGFVQQFLLQSIFLVCALQIFRNKYTAAFVSAALFSIVHAPNLGLMALTLVFGFLCCLLFLRHRNVFTLGITHGIVKEVVRVLFVSVLASKVGYYDYTLRVGPFAGKPEFLGKLEYRGSGALEIPQSGEVLVPVSVTNTSTTTWNAGGNSYPVFLSYHLLDAEMTKRVFSNVLTPLGKSLAPGESELVELTVKAPSKPGEYFVEVDPVMRLPGGRVLYFRSRGLKTIYLPMSSR